MSMTSKVNPTLRAQILTLLAGGIERTNSSIAIYSAYSRRAIQEATQKLTKDGVLEASRTAGQTYYSIKRESPLTHVERFAGIPIKAVCNRTVGT